MKRNRANPVRSPKSRSSVWRALAFRSLWPLCAMLALAVLSVQAEWTQETAFLAPVELDDGIELNIAPLDASTGTTNCVNEVALTPEILTAVRALRNDPTRIYEYVRNRIRYDTPTYGCKNGAHGTLLSGQGNDWDQAALLTAMLRAAGYATRYATAIVYYDTAQLSRWAGFGGHGDYNALGGKVFYNGGWSGAFGTASTSGWHAKSAPGNQEVWTGIRRIWVESEIDGQWRTLDPAFVDCEVSRADIPSLMGYARTNLVAAAMQGSTVGDGWVQNVNEANLDQALTTLTATLRDAIVAEHDAAGVEALVGGRRFVEEAVAALPTTLPHAKDVAAASRTTFDQIPAERLLRVRVQYRGIDRTFAGYELGGRPLTLTHNAADSYKPLLRLDGNTIAIGTSTTSNTTYTLTWTVDQPYRPGWADASYAQTLRSPGGYVLVYDFGTASRQRSGQAARAFERLLADGSPPEGEPARLAAMHASCVSGLEQWKRSRSLLGDVNAALNYTHHFLGVFGQEEGYFVDLPGILSQTLLFSGVTADAVFKADSFLASALEHGMLEQSQGADRTAASTIKVIALNNAKGNRTFLANNGNWSAVRQQLADYTPVALGDLDSRMNAYSVILLPEDGATAVRAWEGHGFAHYKRSQNSQSMGMIIGGGYNGGYAGEPGNFNSGSAQNLVAYAASPAAQTQIAATASKDPVNLRNGDLLVHRPALMVGTGIPPLGVRLDLAYNSGETARQTGLGRGWRHNLDARVLPGSDGSVMFGTRRAADAASMVVATHVLADLLDNNDDVASWTVAALTAQWAIRQTVENIVNVRMGDTALAYVRMPDGSFNPPPGVTSDLVHTNGLYCLRERFGTELRFNDAGRVGSIVDVQGRAMSFAYDAQTNLSSVADFYGRTLAFDYDDGRLIQVEDATGRTVAFAHDCEDLVRFTDPEGLEWTYGYDVKHRLTTLTDPAGQRVASNTFNQAGQVVTQYVGDSGPWFFHCTGQIGTEVDPAGRAVITRFDADGRNLGTEDALGHRTVNSFDAAGHLVESRDAYGATTRLCYDGQHNPTSRIDAAGQTWALAYDASHRLVSVTDPLSNVSRFSYNAAHQITNAVDASGAVSTVAYYAEGDHRGLPLELTDALGGTIRLTYDDYGNPATVTRTAAGTVTHVWNARGDLLETRDPLGHAVTFAYDKRRLLTHATDAAGHTFHRAYGPRGLPATTTDPLGRTTAFLWTPSGEPAAVILPDGAVATNAYDAADRLTAVTGPRGTRVDFGRDAVGRVTNRTASAGSDYTWYDAVGCVTSVLDAASVRTVYGYDILDRPVLAIDGLGREWWTAFDALDRITATTDPRGRTRQYAHDPLGRRTAAIRPSGATDRFGYDGLGNWITYTNAESHVYTMSYDAQSRPLAATNALGQQVFRNFYDPVGNLTNRLDGAGHTITYSYDVLNRLISRQGGAGVPPASLSYDAVGNLLTASNAVAQEAFTYDVMDRVSSATTTVNGYSFATQWKRDPGGLVTNLVYAPGKAVSRTYDPDGRLASITDWLGHTWTFAHDGAGKPTGGTAPGGIISTNQYDAAGRLASWSVGSLAGRTITRDAAGLKTRDDITTGPLPTPHNVRYADNTFDAADRLVAASVRYGSHTNAPVQETYLYDGNGALTNLVSGSTNVFSTTYDPLGQLGCLQGGAGVPPAAFGYDALGNRIVTGDRLWIPDHADPLKRPLIEASLDGTPLRYYLWAPGRLLGFIDAASGALTVAHCDEYGSVVALTDASGNILHTACYGPNGQDWGTTGTNPTSFAWLGGHGVQRVAISDHLGPLYLTRYRLYSASLNRFLSPDPLGLAGGLNLYAYAEGDPLSYIDPLGLCAEAEGRWSAAWEDYKAYAKTSTSIIAAISLTSIAIPDPSDALIQPVAWGGQAANLTGSAVTIVAVTAAKAVADWVTSKLRTNADASGRTPSAPPALTGASTPASPPPPERNPKDDRRLSKKEARERARQEGYDSVEEWKRANGGRPEGHFDLYEGTDDQIYIKPKGAPGGKGIGPGEPMTGW